MLRSFSFRRLSARRAAMALLAATAVSALVVGSGVEARAATPATSAVRLSLVTPYTTVSGRDVTFTGHTSRNLRKHLVVIQRRPSTGGAWVRVGSGLVDAHSLTYRATTKTTGLPIGTYSYRAVGVRSTTVAQSVSAPINVNVWAYYYLSDLTPIGSTKSAPGSFIMRETRYPKSIGQTVNDTTGTVQPSVSFNTGFKCASLTATVGVDDGSVDAIVGFRLAIGVAAEPQYVVNIGNFVTFDATWPLSGYGRIRLTTADSSTSGVDVTGVWGNARLLCSSRPQ